MREAKMEHVKIGNIKAFLGDFNWNKIISIQDF